MVIIISLFRKYKYFQSIASHVSVISNTQKAFERADPTLRTQGWVRA